MTPAQNDSHDSRRMWICLGVGLAVAAALLANLVHLRGDLYGDEWGHTYKVVVTGNFWDNLRVHALFYPPLYFLLARLCYLLAGTLWSIRIPSLLFALAMIPLAGVAARDLLGRRWIVPAAWLAALSPFVLEFATEGRAYAQVICFSLAVAWSFHRFLEREERRSGLILALSLAGGAASHYIFGTVLITVAVYYLAVRRRVTRAALAVGALTGLLLLPVVWLRLAAPAGAFSESLQSDWVQGAAGLPNFILRAGVALNFGFCTFRLPALDPARNVPFSALRDNAGLAIMAFIAGAGVLIGTFQTLRSRKMPAAFLATLVVAPAALAILGGWLGFYLIREKHLALVWGPFSLLLLPALGWLPRRRLGLVALGCYLALAGISNAHFLLQPEIYSRRMDWQGLIGRLDRLMKPGDALAVYEYSVESLSLQPDPVPRREVLRIKIRSMIEGSTSPEQGARLLDKMVPGAIFLVNNETDRLTADPQGEFLRGLASLRPMERTPYGRNLTLYVFARKP